VSRKLRNQFHYTNIIRHYYGSGYGSALLEKDETHLKTFQVVADLPLFLAREPLAI
jgi:hypothetical protein